MTAKVIPGIEDGKISFEKAYENSPIHKSPQKAKPKKSCLRKNNNANKRSSGVFPKRNT